MTKEEMVRIAAVGAFEGRRPIAMFSGLTTVPVRIISISGERGHETGGYGELAAPPCTKLKWRITDYGLEVEGCVEL